VITYPRGSSIPFGNASFQTQAPRTIFSVNDSVPPWRAPQRFHTKPANSTVFAGKGPPEMPSEVITWNLRRSKVCMAAGRSVQQIVAGQIISTLRQRVAFVKGSSAQIRCAALSRSSLGELLLTGQSSAKSCDRINHHTSVIPLIPYWTS